jgi:hypothetical protein
MLFVGLTIMCSMLDPWPRKAWSHPLEIQALKPWARDFDQGPGQKGLASSMLQIATSLENDDLL